MIMDVNSNDIIALNVLSHIFCKWYPSCNKQVFSFDFRLIYMDFKTNYIEYMPKLILNILQHNFMYFRLIKL